MYKLSISETGARPSLLVPADRAACLQRRETPRNSITARDPEATLLNRAAATLADAGEARRLDIARAHEDSVNILTSIGDTVEASNPSIQKNSTRTSLARTLRTRSSSRAIVCFVLYCAV